MSEKKKNEQQEIVSGTAIAISAEKFAAGKAEIMKMLEGVAGAEKLGDLIERGKKKGKLSSSELLDVLEDMDLGSEQMDKIYDVLENLGIETAGEDYLPDPSEDVVPPAEELEEIPEEGDRRPQHPGGLLRR